MNTSPFDPNSFANNHEAVIKHAHLSLNADFSNNILSGSVELTIRAVKNDVSKIVLDTSYLDIISISCDDEKLTFEIAERNAMYGSALTIFLSKIISQDDIIKLLIRYSTTDKCTACQWLTPAQTIGKKHPYMLTQCQAIHARSLLPCQDTPSVKMTYSADLTVPSALRGLMSALRIGESISESGTTFSFNQPVAIPSYLIAIAIGNIEGIKVGPRTTIWSEPEIVKASAWEFAETESFIEIGESLLTPYCWEIYDLLVLPASFPYGGMENPCLTFVTPTLLAGDRSLVDVVAHEIAHSWMGNLVTTQNWEHFWLNEGFTVFIERKIAGRLHGEATRQFNSIIGYKALKESIDLFQETDHMKFSCLCPHLNGCDPDDAFSSVPYEKGYNLLYYLETILGGPAIFEPYLKAHVTKFAHKSIATSEFKTYLFEFFKLQDDGKSKVEILESVDWESWFNKPGMPIIENKFDNSMAHECESLANQWSSCSDSTNYPSDKEYFKSLSSNKKVMFLEKLLLKSKLSHDKLKAMESLYEMSSIKNAEIKFRWQWICLIAEWEEIFGQVVEFITSVGRMKFVRPLYRSLFKCKNGALLARETFLKNKGFYHPICSGMVSKDLGI